MDSMAIDRKGTGPGRPRTLGGNGAGLRALWARAVARITSLSSVALIAVLAFAGGAVATGTGAIPWGRVSGLRSELAARTSALEEARSELLLRNIQNQRLREVQAFSEQYGITADLAATVYDMALSEGLEPAVAFRLIETESSFRRLAVSEAGAVGYTQIKPSTAQWLDPSVTPDQLFDARTNLRLGFRYLSLLMDRYGGDTKLALLSYNRGPERVKWLVSSGRDPANGYASRILFGAH